MAAYKHIKGTPHSGLKAVKPTGTFGNHVMSKVGEGIHVKGSMTGGLPGKGQDYFKGNKLTSKGSSVSVKGGQIAK